MVVDFSYYHDIIALIKVHDSSDDLFDWYIKFNMYYCNQATFYGL